MNEINRLIERAKKIAMSDKERADQRRSFAFGSSKIENDRITRDTMVRAENELLEARRTAKK